MTWGSGFLGTRLGVGERLFTHHSLNTFTNIVCTELLIFKVQATMSTDFLVSVVTYSIISANLHALQSLEKPPKNRSARLLVIWI